MRNIQSTLGIRPQSFHPSIGTNQDNSVNGAGSEASIADRLVKCIRRGDRRAETEFIERYSRGLLMALQHRTKDPSLAEDLRQEALLIVLLRLRRKGLGQPERLAGFLHRTAHNLFIQHCRKMARRGVQSPLECQPIAARQPEPWETVFAGERARGLRNQISCLRQLRDRQILARYYLQEESKARLRKDLGLGDRQFNLVLFRARRRLKAQLANGSTDFV